MIYRISCFGLFFLLTTMPLRRGFRCFQLIPTKIRSRGTNCKNMSMGDSIANMGEDRAVNNEIIQRFPMTRSKPLGDHRQLQHLDQTNAEQYGEHLSAETLWPAVDFDVPSTLKGCITKFLLHATPRFIIVATLCLIGIRLKMPPAISPVVDLLVVIATMAFWTVQEWFLHKYILHAPVVEGGWLGYHIHKSHHSTPFYHVSLDAPEVALVWGAAICAISHVIFPVDSLYIFRLDFVLTYFVMGLLYEWTHYLTHTRYVPKTAFVKSLKTHHMTHHLHDNRCNFAFTLPVMDAWSRSDDFRIMGRT